MSLYGQSNAAWSKASDAAGFPLRRVAAGANGRVDSKIAR